MKRIERGKEAGARMAAALAVDSCWPQTMAQRPGKPALAPAQAEGAGLLGDRLEPRVGGDEQGEAGFEIGLRVEEMGHGWLSCPSTIFGCRRPRKQTIQYPRAFVIDRLASDDWMPLALRGA